ncbi:MAG: hypothetical protein ABIT37_06520 [Luteolibacter sp.]
MKSDGIKRAVRANRHDRAAGDAPSLGRLARMPGTGLPKGTRRRKKRSERGRHVESSVILHWSILFGVLTAIILVAAVYFWLRPQMDAGLSVEGKSTPDREEEVRVRSKLKSPSESEALGIVRHALEISDTGKVAERFHLGTADPQKIVDFLKNLPATDGRFNHYDWVGSVDANDLQLEGVVVTYKSGDKLSQRMAFLTPDEIGTWKIDFDAFARTVNPSWGDFLEKGAETAVVRVFVGEDSYYNGPFSDDKQWICYGLASPDRDETLQGYCKVDSPQAAAIKWMFSKGAKVNRATLEIRRVEGASSRQFEIVKVLAEDWVMAKAPFDEGFK